MSGRTENMGDEFGLEDVIITLRRRIWHFVIPALVLAPLGVLVVMLLPARYTAQGTILVESAQIPPELVRSTVNAYALERIQTIRQRVMTRDRLVQIARQYELFPRSAGYSESERVEKMRSRMEVSLVTADGARSNRRDNTIAFRVSYSDEDPEKAHRIANDFMSLFLSEDARTRTTGASNTTEFFRRETRRLAQAVDELETRIARYKEENAGALPEHHSMHLDMLNRAMNDLAATDASIASLDDEIKLLEAQLTSHLAGASDSGPSGDLAKLRAELARLRAIYTDAHPNIQSIREEIAALEGSLAPSRELSEMQDALAKAELALQEKERELPEDSSEIKQQRAEIERLQVALSDRISREASRGGGDFLSAQMRGRITVANSRRNLLQKQREDLQTRIADLQSRIARTPAVERGLAALTRDHENLFREYQDILAKQQEAQLAENLEDDQKAERFSILEPAVRPEEPSSPERIKLSVLAVFIAFIVGGAVALGSEFLSATVRGQRHLEKIMAAPPIAVIPNFPQEKARPGARQGADRVTKAAAALAMLAAGATLAAADHAALPGPFAERDANRGA